MADLGIFIKTIFQGKGFEEARKAAKSVGDSTEKMSARQIQASKQARDEFGRFVKQSKTGAKGVKGAFQGLSKGVSDELNKLAAGFTVGAVAAGLSAIAVGSFKAAEEAKSATSAFTNLSGSANIARINLQAMDRATRGLISDTEQMKIANQLLGMNIVQTSDQLEQVVGVSRRLGKEFRGLGARDAAEEFAIMIANMSVARLDSFGLSSGRVRERINELMATTKDMTRETAFFQATMEEAEKTVNRLGPELTTSADEVARLGAEWTNLQTAMGKAAEETGIIGSLISSVTNDLVKFQAAFFDESPEAQLKSVNVQLAEEEARLETLREKGNAFFGIFASQIPGAEENIASLKFELQSLLEVQEMLSQQGTEEQARLQAAIASEEKVAENVAKRAAQTEKLAAIQEQFAKDVIAIQAETLDQLSDSRDKFDEDSIKAAESSTKRITDLRKRAAKEEVKSSKKLSKDKAKIDAGLTKSLTKQQVNSDKKIAKTQAQFTKEDKQQRRQRQIDAAGDERLFQFELQNLAADGQGIAIKQALERRAIEQEIASEKAEFEKDVEQDKRKDTIETMRQEGQEARSQLQQQATERKADLETRNLEENEARKQSLVEAELQEGESLAKKQADLEIALGERNAEIEKSEQERVEEIAKGLTEAEDLTNESLDKMIALAGEFGPKFGQTFADGMTKAFSEALKIEDIIEKAGLTFGAGAGGLSAARGTTGTAQSSRGGGIQPFQTGGVIDRSGVGFLHRNEEVANPAEGQSITIGDEQFAVREAGRMASAINAMRQRDMQELVDTVAANL